LGHYKIRAKLGAGGMGEVYLAEDTKLNRKVAIKFLPPESTTDLRAKRRLLREAQAAAALDHPNICAIHEVGEEDGRAFIVMQYVEGETLAARIHRNPLTLNEALGLAIPMADALAEAHARRIIHRDMKPQNVMIIARGQVKMLDFGLAKVVADKSVLDGEAETQSLLTEAGAIVGTVPYMSPEQVKGEALDGRSDIFSFGTVLYEMVSGHRPFSAKTMAEIISAILTSEPPPLAHYSIVAPAGLEQILRKCMEKDRERRYQTMREVARDLESVLRNCESGVAVAQAVDRNAATIRVAATNQVVKQRALLGSRLGLALAALVMLAAVASVYVLFFSKPRTAAPASAKSVNSPAYDYYLRGKVNVSNENREYNETAIKLLQQAIAADPDFAPAYAELARAFSIKAFQWAPDAEKKKLMEDADVTVAKALALDPNLPEGHFARGWLLWTHVKGFPHEQAIQSFKRAIELNPNLDEAHHQLGVVYYHIGLLDKGQEEIERALAINPANTLARFRIGVINTNRGKYEEAPRALQNHPS
jgi:tetratricopeptide (TPR) repeat protein